jgi:hypothetical protein
VLPVTHLYDLAERLRRDHVDGVHFVRAQRLPDGTLAYKVRLGETLATGLAKTSKTRSSAVTARVGRSAP